MKQRLIMASGIGVLATCVTMVSFMWMMLERQLQQADRQQARFEEMLNRMTPSARMFGSLSIDANRPLRGSLNISGGNLQHPADGVLIESAGQDASCVYDFGELSPGIYELTAYDDGWFTRQKFVIRSGDSRREKLFIPEAIEPVLITFTSNLPSQLLIPIDYGSRKKTIAGREWMRNYISGLYLRSTASPADADCAGRVPLKLTCWADSDTGQQLMKAELGPVDPHLSPTHNKANCLTHIIDLDLKPGQNDCHVEVPQEWIVRANARFPACAPACAASVPASAVSPP